MLPWNLLINGASTGFKLWSQRRSEVKAMKHEIAKQELMNGNARAKRKLSALVDVILGTFVLAPFAIIILAPFSGDMNSTLVTASDYINNGLRLLPAEYWYAFFMVVGGNFGVSVSNILSNKAIVKQINKEKK